VCVDFREAESVKREEEHGEEVISDAESIPDASDDEEKSPFEEGESNGGEVAHSLNVVEQDDADPAD